MVEQIDALQQLNTRANQDKIKLLVNKFEDHYKGSDQLTLITEDLKKVLSGQEIVTESEPKNEEERMLYGEALSKMLAKDSKAFMLY